jgi:hypothetical protein
MYDSAPTFWTLAKHNKHLESGLHAGETSVISQTSISILTLACDWPGPLLDSAGGVVGVHVGASDDTGSCYAVPIATLFRLMDQVTPHLNSRVT